MKKKYKLISIPFLLTLLVISLLIYSPPLPQSKSYTSKNNIPVISSNTIVLIHGMFLNSESWFNWKNYLESKGFDVHVPSWPFHDRSVKEMRSVHPEYDLGKLSFTDVKEHLTAYIKTLDEKPILIGHSMGGLLAQVLLEEDLGIAAIGIDSAPPSGIIAFEWSFFKSAWPIISPFADSNIPFLPNLDEFSYSFLNTFESKEERKIIWETYAVPESRQIPVEVTKKGALLNYNAKTAPLLLIAGEKDQTIPPILNYKNFKKYKQASSLTTFKLFMGRSHFICIEKGWKEVADYTLEWLRESGLIVR